MANNKTAIYCFLFQIKKLPRLLQQGKQPNLKISENTQLTPNNKQLDQNKIRHVREYGLRLYNYTYYMLINGASKQSSMKQNEGEKRIKCENTSCVYI